MGDPAFDLIDELAAVGADAVHRGLVLASGGNLSPPIPGRDAFVVTGKGTWLDRLGRDDFAVMALGGALVDGTATPSSEWKLHQRTYQARPDVHAVPGDTTTIFPPEAFAELRNG